MLFNSFDYIFLFLPIAVILYYFLNRMKLVIAAKMWLVVSSLFFYSWWNISYLPLILISIGINYGLGYVLNLPDFRVGSRRVGRKPVLVAGIIFNVGLLAYYKYFDFFIANTNAMFKTNLPLLHLALPLAISFYTFQQIAFLVDTYRRETKEFSLLNYALFVTFFPQLIAGPIVHHKGMMPQFQNLRNYVVNYKNQASGLFIFSIGLFKKVILADTFAIWATQGFDRLETLTFIEAWVVSLSYTFQLYFDFSGYMDMAMGAALLFNIRLPINFNSPYKSLNIQEAWGRWHITLSQFLYRYIYKPLNKFLLQKVFIPLRMKSQVMLRTSVSLCILFFISGFWHGAGWTFIIFGLLHGLANVIHRYWNLLNYKMNKFFAWFITFNLINALFVFFRASSIEDAMKVFKGMIGLNGILLPTKMMAWFPNNMVRDFVDFGDIPLNAVTDALKYLVIGFIIILCFKNSVQLLENFKPKWYIAILTFILFGYSLLNLTKVSEFLYFNF